MKLTVNKREFEVNNKQELIDRINENSNRNCDLISLKNTKGSELRLRINRVSRRALVYFNGMKKYYESSDEAFFHMNTGMFSDRHTVSSTEGFDALEFFYDTGLCQMDQPDKRDNEILM